MLGCVAQTDPPLKQLQLKFLSLPGTCMNLAALVANPTPGDKQREAQSPSPLFELGGLQMPTTPTATAAI